MTGGEGIGPDQNRPPCYNCGYRPTIRELEESGGECPECGLNDRLMNDQTRCWSCQAFLADGYQGPGGFYCPNCGDEPHASELEANGWNYNGVRWVSPSNQ